MLCILAAGCSPGAGVVDGGTGGMRDASVFNECSSICLRPSDCAPAFPDDGYCPPGFLCSREFHCGG
jgi:hypothetical protein